MSTLEFLGMLVLYLISPEHMPRKSSWNGSLVVRLSRGRLIPVRQEAAEFLTAA